MDGVVVYSSIVLGVGIVVGVWWFLNWVWVRPKKMEKLLRKQGFKGNPYRVWYGDLRQQTSMVEEAMSKPINISDDIVPRVIPFVSHHVDCYGKKSFIWNGPTANVVIVDPEMVKEVFTKNFVFQKPTANPLFRMFLIGLPSIEGEKWAKHRRLLKPAFLMERLKDMLPAFDLCCCKMTTKWQQKMLEGNSCELDVMPYLQTLTSDVISHTAFGSSYEEGSRVFELQIEQLQLAIETLQSVYIPGSRYLPTRSNQRMKEIDKEVRLSLKRIIDKKLEVMKTTGKGSNDLLGILLESNLNEVQHGNGSMGMSTQDVIDECKLFYFAGQETTSVSLAWTLLLLSLHPNWQDKARKEVLHVIGKRKPEFADLSQLKIVTMILYEVLRLYPPVTLVNRIIHEETKLGDVTLPPGVLFTLPIQLIHHDREIWGDDVKIFNPERFSEGVSKATKNRTVFLPFGGGPRICIGQNFALLEIKFAIAMMLAQFSFELSPSYTHAPACLGSLRPQHGVNLIIHKL
uniref:Cytochrome P450 CYP72A508 n=1 Tax=Eleutherococcus senticosus TaxID=82096 RepID=A0A1P8W6Z9_9APIA|nr:cytochrome P450 CYP72A508 [Eleutherococcus senticosus]